MGNKKERKLVDSINKFFNQKELKLLTEDNWINKISKIQGAKFMELVWFNLGKTQAKEKELENSINEIHTLITLVLFEKLGLTKRNKEGYYERTQLGEEVKKIIK